MHRLTNIQAVVILCNLRGKIIREIHGLNHFCGSLSYNPLRHSPTETLHQSLHSCNLQDRLPAFFPIYLSWSVSYSAPLSFFEKLIVSKNGRLGQDFTLVKPPFVDRFEQAIRECDQGRNLANQALKQGRTSTVTGSLGEQPRYSPPLSGQ